MLVSCLRNSKHKAELPFDAVLDPTNEEIAKLHYWGYQGVHK
jgi:hypothetical protein